MQTSPALEARWTEERPSEPLAAADYDARRLYWRCARLTLMQTTTLPSDVAHRLRLRATGAKKGTYAPRACDLAELCALGHADEVASYHDEQRAAALASQPVGDLATSAVATSQECGEFVTALMRYQSDQSAENERAVVKEGSEVLAVARQLLHVVFGQRRERASGRWAGRMALAATTPRRVRV